MWSGCPAKAAPRSLSRNGTPLNGPSWSESTAAARPSSNSGWITAFSSGLSSSTREIAASTSSVGVASPFFTSAACAVASSPASSDIEAGTLAPAATSPRVARLERPLGRFRCGDPAQAPQLELERVVDAAAVPVSVLDLARGVRVADDDVIGADRDLAVAAWAAVELAGHGPDQDHLLALVTRAGEAEPGVGQVVEPPVRPAHRGPRRRALTALFRSRAAPDQGFPATPSTCAAARSQDALEPDRERLLEIGDPAHREQYAGHERAAVDRGMADRARLPLSAELPLLGRDEARQAHRVNRLVDVAAVLANQLGGPLRVPRGRVELAIVVELDDLALGHLRLSLAGQLHHQHGTDREVGRHQHVGAVPGLPLDLSAKRLEVEAGRPDHRVDAGGDAGERVLWRRLRGREVDDDVGIVEAVGELDPERGVCAARQVQVIGALDRGADRRAHPPGGSGHRDPDHAAVRASWIDPTARRNRSSSGPMQAADRRPGS